MIRKPTRHRVALWLPAFIAIACVLHHSVVQGQKVGSAVRSRTQDRQSVDPFRTTVQSATPLDFDRVSNPETSNPPMPRVAPAVANAIATSTPRQGVTFREPASAGGVTPTEMPAGMPQVQPVGYEQPIAMPTTPASSLRRMPNTVTGGPALQQTSGLQPVSCGCELAGCDDCGFASSCGAGGCDSMGCSGVAGCGCGSCGYNQYGIGPVFGSPDRFFADAELLLFWRDGGQLPILATTGPDTDADTAGEIGQAGTVTLFGGETVGEEIEAGGRVTFGWYLDGCNDRSLVFRYWGVGDATIGDQFNSQTTPVIARPFFNVTDG
ncbi:MAG: BBP7 family outer membrane beta-barrel protein, partial [Planctomycetota bacterium]